MRLPGSVYIYILSRTVCQLTLSSGQINYVPVVNAFILGNLSEYRHKSYIARTRLVGTIFSSQIIWVYLQPLCMT